eukprot:c8052_g2_i1.p1 GENE.c8052_g2_i1~~c8052_g2_i1.p1  ORF type:complete len:150 (+),score=42.26 c8052_g2_i1:128-577(+)
MSHKPNHCLSSANATEADAGSTSELESKKHNGDTHVNVSNINNQQHDHKESLLMSRDHKEPNAQALTDSSSKRDQQQQQQQLHQNQHLQPNQLSKQQQAAVSIAAPKRYFSRNTNKRCNSCKDNSTDSEKCNASDTQPARPRNSDTKSR